MCGIWAIFGSDEDVSCQCQSLHKISHRGPDAFRLETIKDFPGCCIGFRWLSITDDLRGMQPIRLFSHPHVWLIYNGEIYNHLSLEKEFDLKCSTDGDGECIIHLYEMGGAEFAAKHLDGVFAFCIVDTRKRKVFLGRDTYGVRPLFRLHIEEDGFLACCSEAKGLFGLQHSTTDEEANITPFLPGHIEEYDIDSNVKVHFNDRYRYHSIGTDPTYPTLSPTLVENDVAGNIRKLLNYSVRKRMMTIRRIGCLLSGGLDSSLTTALVVKNAKEMNLGYKVQTFSIGMEGSPDLKYARIVADYLDTEHHEVIFTPEEGIDALNNLIYHLESYDITTVRASTGMYLICKYIRQKTDTIVIMSGEGADEVGQGYIYFHKAPSADEAHVESLRLLNDLYMYDVLRSDRSTAASGLEVRVPLLDHKLTAYYLSLDPESRKPQKGIEKYLIRSAFEGTNLLPDEILWRPKEAFSDGVSSVKRSWFQVLQDHVEAQINDSELEEAPEKFPYNTPKTKEALYYRKIFESYYPGKAKWIPYMWMPKWLQATDPSARTLKHYKQKE